MVGPAMPQQIPISAIPRPSVTMRRMRMAYVLPVSLSWRVHSPAVGYSIHALLSRHADLPAAPAVATRGEPERAAIAGQDDDLLRACRLPASGAVRPTQYRARELRGSQPRGTRPSHRRCRCAGDLGVMARPAG